MADIFSKTKRSWVMSQVRSRYNKSTELRFIELMRERGITGWRRGYKLPGSPDFTFVKPRFAVFIDGCFWHGCPVHGRIPETSADYWRAKIERNKERDKEVGRKLRARGWRVRRFWEHELKPRSLNRRKLRALERALQTAD